jgi:hypothetical protein
MFQGVFSPVLLHSSPLPLSGGKHHSGASCEELRWKTGANPGNAGVQPGATSLVFHRGVGSGHGVGFGDAAPLQAQSIDAPPLPARVFRAGRGGSGAKRVSVRQYGKCFFLKSLLHLTEFKINCNSADRKSGKVLAERAEFWVLEISPS